mgnify:CR=1 FL=1
MTLAAPTIHSPGPLMQFPARIGRSNACVRVQKSRLEWSQVGRQWAIQMAPMTTITAVTLEPGPLKSSLIISMTVGTADFSVESGTAEQARTLLMQLIAVAAERSPVAVSVPPAASCSDSADDMINLTWMNDARTVDPLDLEAEPARLLGKERFQVFVAQIGRRLAGDHRLVSEVLESIATNEPDLFATASDDAPLQRRATAAANGARADAKAEERTPKPPGREGNGHG